VTVEQIAEAADVGKGTIYNYFNAKEDIVVAFMAEIEARVQVRLGRFVGDKRPLESILAEFIEFQFRLKRPYHLFVRVFLSQMFLSTEQLLPYMVEMQKVIDPQLEELFRGLHQRGLIRAEIDIPQLILTFKTMHLGLTALWAVEGPPFLQTKKTVQQQMKLFCEGIQRRR
jgi:TetR/AcrR family transcriptional regulator, regulator of autoinduction and epiphytic fitness